MPLINVKVIDGVFTPEQKTQIAERLTDAMVSVEGENMRPVTWCVIDEVNSGDWAVPDHGGRARPGRRSAGLETPDGARDSRAPRAARRLEHHRRRLGVCGRHGSHGSDRSTARRRHAVS